MATEWRIYGEDTIAYKMDKAELPGLFSKKFTVGPGEAALVIREGKVSDVITEDKMQVSGVLDRCASLFKKGTEVDIVFVDTSPTDLEYHLGDVPEGEGERDKDEKQPFVVKALSKDHETITAVCRLTLHVSLDNAGALARRMKGRFGFATWDLLDSIGSELLARVLVPRISQHSADDFRGNTALHKQIEADVGSELGKSLKSWGMTLDNFVINWGLTDSERREIEAKRLEREEAARKFFHQRRLKEMERELELDRTRIINLQQIKTAEAKGDNELKALYLAAEIDREQMQQEQEVHTAQVDARIQEIQLDVERREGQLKLEQQRAEEMLRLDMQDREFKQQQQQRLAEIEADDKEMASMVRMKLQMSADKHEREMQARRQEIDAENRRRRQEIEDRYQQRKLKLDESNRRMDMTERIMSQGLSSGVANSDNIDTMLTQNTEQEYATTSDEKVKARSEAQGKAEAARGNLDAYKEAEDRERCQQQDMTRLSTDMMQGAKQQPPGNTDAEGPESPQQPPSSPPQTPNVNVVNVPGVAPQPPQPDSQGGGQKCSHCAEELKPGWKACPACGQKIGPPEPQCPGCSAAVKETWKACPECGLALAEPGCTACGAEMQPGWKACPACGEKL